MTIKQLYELYLKYPKVSTDTRKIEVNSLFFALKGERFNGNIFAQEALAKGAAYAIIDEPNYQTKHTILVKNVLQTLQDLAKYKRSQFSIPVIAVGGSNGKTTTKELTYKVLAKKYKAFATQGNLNNHIGVPLTLLDMPHDTEIAVIELGANHLEETYALCQIAQPTHGIVTNIGLDHLEGFGSIEGVMRANAELYEYLAQNNGIAFVNTSEKLLLEALKNFPNLQKITYPQANDYFSATLLENDFFIKIQVKEQEISTQLFGAYNFANAAAALCIGQFFEVEPSLAYQAIAEYVPQNMRSQVIQQGTNTIILDAYNANPSSMEQAIRQFAKIKGEKKVLILGMMNELGATSPQEHEKLGKLIAQYNFSTIILFGEDMKYALSHLPQAYYFTDKFSLHNWLQDHKINESQVLIKGSRSMQLETVVQFL
ncbi:MAG: UDP-N-acetylmuramoyl-tripeptide--D-alanyl-D-alanine ligase [Microscillaceae bacterium]|nr:UDP-N-acetylmuramoyl-tripeptide--D-alanyl-D-alanine ligase [Microscillaceae bacterium]MDW8460961.1 UDP-N-acetylmuramoyl-tripeptide--D-alanyl-D-alanine ligase [Cytophagales bacterium]